MLGAGLGEFALGGFPLPDSLSVTDPLPGLLADIAAPREFLLRSSPGGVTVDLSSSGYNSLPADSVYKLFPGGISRPYNFSVELPLPNLSGGASLGVGELLVNNSDGSLDSTATQDWLGADADVFIGRKPDSLSLFTRFFRGKSAGVSWNLDSFSILHRDLRFKLQKRLQPKRYRGFGSCVRYDGVDDSGSATLTCPAGSMTVQAEARAALSSANGVIANWRNGAGAGLRLLYQNGTKWTFGVRNDAGTVFEAVDTENIVPGRLDNVTGVLDVSGSKVYVYVDGRKGAETTISGTFNTVLGTFITGRTEVSSLFFNGDIDEVRVWSVARTQSQIQSDKDRQLVGSETNLFSYWKFDEGAGTTAANSVPTKPSITLSGSPVWVGSLEGDASLAGNPKPICVGVKRYISPKLVDPQRLVYQVHDVSVLAIDAVYDSGDDYTFGSDVSDIYSSTPSAGTYNTQRTDNGSYFRLGSSPVGVVQCTVRGDNSGSLGYVDTLSGVHRKIATRTISDDDLNLLTYAGLTSKTVAKIGFYFDSEINADAALDEIAKKGGSAWWAPDRVGRISVGRIDDPTTLTPDVTITIDDIVDPSEGGSFKRSPVGVRVGTVKLGYRRYNTQLTADQVAGTVDLATRTDLGEEYRYVTSEDPNRSADADTLEILTELDLQSDAQAEADRLLALWKVDRAQYRITLDQGLLSYFIGSVFNVVVDRYDTAAGKKFVVFRVDETMGQFGAPDRLETGLFG